MSLLCVCATRWRARLFNRTPLDPGLAHERLTQLPPASTSSFFTLISFPPPQSPSLSVALRYTQERDAAHQMLDYLTTPSERQVDVTALSRAIKTARKKGVAMAQIQKAKTKLAASTKALKVPGITLWLTLHCSICAPAIARA